jgi:predicted ATPase
MGQLFVSYASVDRERTLEIAAAVRAHGLDVWIDQAGIAGGTAYGAEIANALRDAEAVVLIASDASLASKNVRQEIMLAWRYDRPIIPLILHPLVFPDDVAYWLEGAQWIEAFDRPAEEWLPKLWQALARHGIVEARDERDAQAAAVSPVPVQVTGNLPSGLAPIIGREREIQEVLTLLANGRTITLTGPGGTGKTRLALEVGRRIGPSYDGGAWFLDLSSTHAAELVLPGIAALLDVDVPPDGSPVEAIARVLVDTPALLILDNLEQILDAAADLAALQAAAPDLTLLMTSRAPLQLPREWVYAVPQLVLPDLQALATPSALLENPAVRLFVTRAQQAKPDFQLIDGNARAVAEICHRLDGLPLAIEIAAARVRLLPPAAMLTRLGSRLNLLTRGSAANARQQTLRDTIGWSYNLLEPEQQWAFRSFAVFEGGASVGAAESVLSSLNAEASEPPLDLLEHLVDQSLLVIGTTDDGEPRLRMLETVREYASEQLMSTYAADATHDRYADFFVDWIAVLTPELIDGRDNRPFRAVRSELGNLRGALDWLRAHDAGDRRLRLVCDLFAYWRAAGPYPEAEGELRSALECVTTGSERYQGRASEALGWLEGARGHFDDARFWYERAMQLYESIDDTPRQIEVHAQLAKLAEFSSNYREARAHHERRRMLLHADDALGIAQVDHDLGTLAFIEGNIPEGIRMISSAIEIYRGQADAQLIAYALIDLASAELLNGDREASLSHIEESVSLLRTLRDDYALAVAIVTRGRALQLAGELEAAQMTLEGALDDANRLGDASLQSLAFYGLGVNATFLGEWTKAERWLQQGFILANSMNDGRRISEILEVLARAMAGAGQMERATRLLGRADIARRESRTSIPPAHRGRYEETVALAQSALGMERYGALFAAGRMMEPQDLIGGGPGI